MVFTPTVASSYLHHIQIRLGCQGHVHELGSRSSWCGALRFGSFGQGRRNRQANGRDCELDNYLVFPALAHLS